MKIAVALDMTSCSLVDIYGRFGEGEVLTTVVINAAVFWIATPCSYIVGCQLSKASTSCIFRTECTLNLFSVTV